MDRAEPGLEILSNLPEVFPTRHPPMALVGAITRLAL
jgi:hypothetical protein